jgi:peptidoglycan/xylan/chitin deacetylase (PgdA/CDA1 family)
MKVYLTFDVEVWCRSWAELDADFPRAFRRYVFGRSSQGDFALPATLEILAKHGLHGVFFVEPLFAARFGENHLRTIVELIQGAGQEVQLHLHPEWTDEITPPPIERVASKRQHLSDYDLDEQTTLIAYGLRLLRAAGAEQVNAFRAGSFAANAVTFDALRSNGLTVDSSVDPASAVSVPDLRRSGPIFTPTVIRGISELPLTVFRDGLGRLRHAQVGACSALEIQEALESAVRGGAGSFVIVSHNFEMLKPGREEPDPIVVRRFERLCRTVSSSRELESAGFRTVADVGRDSAPQFMPTVSTRATAIRLVEQLRSRLS